MSIMFGRLGIDRSRSDLLEEEALSWRSFKYLGSQTLIHLIDQGEAFVQRCSFNLIMRKVTKLKFKFLTLSLQY